MIDLKTWSKAWGLLERREQRIAFLVLGVVILTALSTALMVGSVFPFLAVLSDPDKIHEVQQLSWAYDWLGFESDYSFLYALGLFSLATIVLVNAIQLLNTYVVARFSLMRIHSISCRLLSGYLRQPYEFFLNRHSGSMATSILSESGQVVQAFIRPAADLIASFITVLAIISFLLWVNPLITFAAFLIVGGVYGGTFYISRSRLRKLGDRRLEMNLDRFQIAHEAIGGIKDVKILGREAAYVQRYHVPSWEMARMLVIFNVVSALPQFVVQPVAFGGIIFLCLALVDRSSFEAGGNLGDIIPLLGVFAFAGQRLMPEFTKLYHSLTQLQYSSAAVDSVADDLALVVGTDELPTRMPPAIGLRKYLKLEAVTYRYPNAEMPGIADLSLTIRCGEKIGVVGSTGAGKTTLVDIVLGLLRPQTGRLIVDDTKVTQDRLRPWQQTVGYVPQDIFLIDASIAENIALGVPTNEIDMSRIVASAKLAQLDGFIKSELPNDYQTEIGERGVRLSGGQRQRVGIARALYHDADLIVFDEATSALDNLTERDVMSAIENLPGNKTILMIAHRLSTVRICDRLIVLENGRMVAFGSWDELVAESALFQSLVRSSETG